MQHARAIVPSNQEACCYGNIGTQANSLYYKRRFYTNAGVAEKCAKLKNMLRTHRRRTFILDTAQSQGILFKTYFVSRLMGASISSPLLCSVGNQY